MSTPKTVDHLRDTLFEVIAGVRDKTIPLDRAKAIAELTQVIVNSSKVEVEFLKATNGKGRASGFLGRQDGAPEPEPTPTTNDDLPAGIVGVRQHRISDAEPGEDEVQPTRQS